MLTDRQRHKLAKEARKLAMEVVNNRAPPMISNHRHLGGQHCVLGWLEARTGLDFLFHDGSNADVAERLLAEENNHATDENRHASVLFPLLAFADALEEPRAAPSPTPNTRKER